MELKSRLSVYYGKADKYPTLANFMDILALDGTEANVQKNIDLAD